MSLYDTVKHDMVASLKARDELRLGVLRMLIAALQNQEIDKHAKFVKAGKEPEPLGDEEVIAVIDRESKKRKETSAEYDKAGKADARDQELAEAKILDAYLPERLHGDALRQAVLAAYNGVPETDKTQFGKAMQHVSAALKGKADMAEVSAVLREMMQPA